MSPRKPISPEDRKGYSGKKIHVFFLNIRARRLELELTQKDLAQALNLPQQSVSDLEGGMFPNTPEKLIALADALETDLNTLFGIEVENIDDH